MISALLMIQVRPNLDYDKFRRSIEHRITVVSNAEDFKSQVTTLLNGFIKAHPFKYSEYYGANGIAKIQNTTWMLFSIGSMAEAEQSFVARPDGSTYHIELVDSIKSVDRYQPQQGVLSNGKLILMGQTHVQSNYESPAVGAYRQVRDRWVVVKQHESNFQGWPGNLHLANDEWSALATGRQYPKHVSVPHSGAHVLMAQRYRVRNGALTIGPLQYLPCELKTMDDLIAASQTKNWTKVKQLSATDEVYQQFRKLTLHAPKKDWRPVEEAYLKMYQCQIPSTDKVAVVEKVGSDYKLTKILAVKDEG